MGARRTHRYVTAYKVDVYAENHGHQADDRRDRRQQYRTKANRAGSQHGVVGVEAAAAKYVIRVDEHDIVVHHDARERNNADAGHDDAERLAHREMSQEDATRRKEYRGEYQACLVDAVELGYENNGHDRESHQHRSFQERHILFLVFRAAAKSGAHSWVD